MQHDNSLRKILESGDVALGGQTVTHSPEVVEACGELGLDFVWVDFEHIGPAPHDAQIFENLVRAAEVSGTEILVRTPTSDPSLVRKVLDSSVRNLLIPRVETAKEVRSVVEASRFSYDGDVGERGIASSRASGWGSALNDEYMNREDSNVSVGVMIENITAVGNLSEILSVEDLGFIMIGQADLSVSLGYPLDFEHTEVKSTIEEIREKSKAHDVPVGRVVSTTEDARRAIKNGAQMVRISGGEISAVRDQLENHMTELDDLS